MLSTDEMGSRVDNLGLPEDLGEGTSVCAYHREKKLSHVCCTTFHVSKSCRS